MGKKFTSIHILDSNIDDVSIRLAQCQFDGNIFKESQLRQAQSQNKLDVSKLVKMMSIIGPKHAIFYLVETNNNISVFSEYFSSQAIKDAVKKWFWGFDKYVLSIDYFDDDFFEIHVFKNNKFITSLVMGDNLQPYALSAARFDENEICAMFHIKPTDIEKAYDPDIFKTCNNLSDLFQLPLTLETKDVISSKRLNIEEIKFNL